MKRYRITLRCKKKNYMFLKTCIQKVYDTLDIRFFDDEVQFIIFTNQVEEAKLRLLNKILDEYENKFLSDVFVEIKDLLSGEPFVNTFTDVYKIGSIHIKYLWDSFSLKETSSNDILLFTDHGFGNGQHPTTSMCIEMMQEVLEKEDIKRVLDFGCGTGILGIIASKVYRVKETIGVDIDPLSVKTAVKNARLNGVENRTIFMEGSWDRVNGTFDLILANLTPFLIKESCDRIYTHLNLPGFAVVSGILKSQFKEIKALFQDTGFRVTNIRLRMGWVGMGLKK